MFHYVITTSVDFQHFPEYYGNNKKSTNFKYFRQPTLIGLLKQKNYPKFLVVMQDLILLHVSFVSFAADAI